MSTKLRWTIKDLELFEQPLDDKRYELICGELHVSTQPHWHHQATGTETAIELGIWNRHTGAGQVVVAPGVVFSVEEAVAPDIVWVSRERMRDVLGDDGKLHAAPDLVVEILSAGGRNETRDRELKLDLYSRYGVREYWILDWRTRTIAIYRRQNAGLQCAATLSEQDMLTSPMLSGFEVQVARLFPDPRLLG